MEDMDIKEICQKYNISVKELSQILGFNEQSLRNAISDNRLTQQTKASLKLFIEVQELKRELAQFKNLKATLKEIMNN